jgi:hypothetical protein
VGRRLQSFLAGNNLNQYFSSFTFLSSFCQLEAKTNSLASELAFENLEFKL